MQKNPIIVGDEIHITNILYNLLDNAIKYCDKIPDIKINTTTKNKGIEIAIIDNGKGISNRSKKMIFEKFYRVPSGNVHDVKGFGLGLFYVKNMIKLHKGKIDLESIQTVGTMFTIWLKNKK
jgi:two-component system phosphate regulon sensor histidine kinase PhoR